MSHRLCNLIVDDDFQCCRTLGEKLRERAYKVAVITDTEDIEMVADIDVQMGQLS